MDTIEVGNMDDSSQEGAAIQNVIQRKYNRPATTHVRAALAMVAAGR